MHFDFGIVSLSRRLAPMLGGAVLCLRLLGESPLETGIRLKNGDFLSTLPQSVSEGRMIFHPRWSRDALSIPLDRLRHFQNPKVRAGGAVSVARLELSNGDRLSLPELEMNEAGVLLAEAPWGGRLRIPLADTGRIRLVPEERLVQSDPAPGNGLEPVRFHKWRGMKQGVFAGRALRELNPNWLGVDIPFIPERFLLELELSVNPADTNYRLNLFNPAQGSSLQRAMFTQQVMFIFNNRQVQAQWHEVGANGRRVIQKWIRNLEAEASVHRIRIVGDRSRNRILFQLNGEITQVWDLPLLEEPGLDQATTLSVQRMSPDPIRINSFELVRWDGEPDAAEAFVSEEAVGVDRLVFYDGAAVDGTLRGLTEAVVRFTPLDEKDSRGYARGKVYEIHLSNRSGPDKGDPGAGVPATLFTGRNGDRLGVRLLTLENDILTLRRDGWPIMLEVPLEAVDLLKFPSTPRKMGDG